MTFNEISNNAIRDSLLELLELKSLKDGKKFTPSRLAASINIQHSMIVKLLHIDPEKRVFNPRIETLEKITSFFQSEGFLISIDDLIKGFKKSKAIDVRQQQSEPHSDLKSFPLFELSFGLDKKIGAIDVKLNKNTFADKAFITSIDIKPFFKKGSVFLVDSTETPKSNNLLLIKNSENELLIKKLLVENSCRYFVDLNNLSSKDKIMPTDNIFIVGVITQINAKT